MPELEPDDELPRIIDLAREGNADGTNRVGALFERFLKVFEQLTDETSGAPAL